MIKELYYRVVNGGDGSAYVRFFESKELATWDEEHDWYRWAEPCINSIEIETDGEIKIKEEIVSKEHYWLENYFGGYEDAKEDEKEFLKEFFPNGLPKFKVEFVKNYLSEFNNKEYGIWNVFVGDILVKKMWRDSEIDLEKELNNHIKGT